MVLICCRYDIENCLLRWVRKITSDYASGQCACLPVDRPIAAPSCSKVHGENTIGLLLSKKSLEVHNKDYVSFLNCTRLPTHCYMEPNFSSVHGSFIDACLNVMLSLLFRSWPKVLSCDTLH